MVKVAWSRCWHKVCEERRSGAAQVRERIVIFRQRDYIVVEVPVPFMESEELANSEQAFAKEDEVWYDCEEQLDLQEKLEKQSADADKATEAHAKCEEELAEAAATKACPFQSCIHANCIQFAHMLSLCPALSIPRRELWRQHWEWKGE